ncbi:EAL domain-containing protein (plasmid) [Aeromonas dhakensis]|uniref:EAL domain-containing protein n=1 Tax=Aeromonas dhakensis TaxID=196024 RepID=UPI0021B2BDE8|nr:EAL domain-containing protein [Aeromonas dhakensis]UXB09950.1 EAL domain-containing protein [Aeromonas dhakensis]
MATYKVKNTELQLRLEPIVSLHDGIPVGFEALSRVVTCLISCNSFDYETFFRSLDKSDCEYVIERQLEIYQKWTRQHPEIYMGKFLFINVHPAILEDSDACQRFLPYLRCFSIAIEIDSHLSEMSEKAKANIAALKTFGVQIWIDDFPGYGRLSGAFWSGVKIDRWAFQQSFKSSGDGDEYCDFSVVSNIGPLVIEGIESKAHLAHAIGLGARYGQGYLWAAHSMLQELHGCK